MSLQSIPPPCSNSNELPPPTLVISLSLSPHQGRCQCANVSMWSNCNLSSGPDYPNHRSSSNFLKFLKVQNADLWLAPTVALRVNQLTLMHLSHHEDLQILLLNYGRNCISFIESFCVKTIENDAFQPNNWLYRFFFWVEEYKKEGCLEIEKFLNVGCILSRSSPKIIWDKMRICRIYS